MLGDSYYAVGATASSGYREYKGESDHYRNEVIALVFTRICDAAGHVSRPRAKVLSIRSDRAQAGDKESIASFTIGDRIFAARTREIVEAVDDAAIMPIPLMRPGMRGCFIYEGAAMPVFDLAPVLYRSRTRAARMTRGRRSSSPSWSPPAADASAWWSRLSARSPRCLRIG